MQTGAQVTAFVNSVNTNVYANWAGLSPQQRAQGVLDAGTAVLTAVGVTIVPTLNFATAADNSRGSFGSGTWVVTVGAGMVPDNPDQAAMLNVCTTIYHELRHCQQFYLLARFVAQTARSAGFLRQNLNKLTAPQQGMLNANPVPKATLDTLARAYIAALTGMPANVILAAVGNPLPRGNAFEALCKKWYAALYGTGGERLLAQLADHATIRVRTSAADYSDQRYARVYDQYFQNQAHEADAFQTEQLVASDILTRNLF